jgi:hypothetical protein
MTWLIFAMSVFHLAHGSPEQLDSACPIPWVDGSLVDLGCLLFNSTATYTWEGASVYCQQEEIATLVEIWTEAQLDFIRMELRMLAANEGARYWWTSGTDVGREGSWNWASSSASVGDFIWQTNHPDSGFDGNCLYLESSYDYLGNDYSCTVSSNPICQRNQ